MRGSDSADTQARTTLWVARSSGQSALRTLGTPRCGGNHGRNYSPKWQDTEETLAAGVAAVGRQAERGHQPGQNSACDKPPGNPAEIKVATPRAVRITGKPKGHRPCIEALVARTAPPGPQPEQRCGEIDHATSVRSSAICATALRANHLCDSPIYSGAAE